jgi:hypothetical protein
MWQSREKISFLGQHLGASGIQTKRQEGMMSALKAVRNILGTAGLLFAGYVFVVSLKDSLRYIKISSM